MLQANGCFVSGTKRFDEDDRASFAQDSLHLDQPFIEFTGSIFLIPNREVAHAPARDHEISGMIFHRQLAMVGDIYLPVGQTAGNQSLPANPQHLRRDIDGPIGFDPRRKQELQTAGPCAEVENLQAIYIDDLIYGMWDIPLIIFARDQRFVTVTF
jgi:hypothetical protein